MSQLGIDESVAERLDDRRDQQEITHSWGELLRTAVPLSQGWRYLVDAHLLRDDPVLRLAASERRGDFTAAARHPRRRFSATG